MKGKRARELISFCEEIEKIQNLDAHTFINRKDLRLAYHKSIGKGETDETSAIEILDSFEAFEHQRGSANYSFKISKFQKAKKELMEAAKKLEGE